VTLTIGIDQNLGIALIDAQGARATVLLDLNFART
jgi:hypothetical protein